MTTIKKIEKKCKICGKTYSYEIREDDGCDWFGHHYSSPQDFSELDECPFCHKDIKQLKRMCLNCQYNENGFCQSKEEKIEINKVAKMFIVDKLQIIDETLKCNFHKLDTNFIEKIFVK